MLEYKIIRSTCTKEHLRLIDLWKAHWEEIGMADTKHLTLDMDLEYYKILEEQGRYFGIGIETATGTLVGYISIMTSPHPHHKTEKFAIMDGIFMLPEHRTAAGGLAWYKGFREAERIALEEYGCSYMKFTYSVNKDLSKLGERLGYSPCDISMIKELKRGS